jgi:predicted nucleic acid-binding protein
MRIVVDATVVVASLMADGRVRDVLLSSRDLEFFAPRYTQVELERNLSRIASRSRVSLGTVRALTEDAFESVELLPASVYTHLLADATALAKAADARGDEEYIATALFLDAPIWTLDKDFRRVKGIKCLNTQEVSDLTS